MAKETIKAPTEVKLNLPEFGEAVSYTGESIRLPRLVVPTIRVSYKDEGDEARVCPKGEFVEYNQETKVTTPLGKKITIQILHHRQSLSAYKDLGGGKSESYYTPEISMKSKSAPLFMAKADSSGRQNMYLMDGEIKKDGPLRTSYPELRYQRSLYVLHEGVLKNLVVYGASFSGFIDFTKSIQPKSSASVFVELSTKKEKTGAVTYYPMVFTAGNAVDMKVAEPTLKQLSEWFDELDKRVAAQQSERAAERANDRGDAPENADVKAGLAPKPTGTIAEQIKEDDEEEPVKEKDLPF